MTRLKPKGTNIWKSVQGQTQADQNKNKPGQPREISLRESAVATTECERESWSGINQASEKETLESGRWSE